MGVDGKWGGEEVKEALLYLFIWTVSALLIFTAGVRTGTVLFIDALVQKPITQTIDGEDKFYVRFYLGPFAYEKEIKPLYPEATP